MRRALAGLTLMMLGALPASAQRRRAHVRLGALFPSEESNLFLDDRVLYTVDEGDWTGFTGGVEYSARIAQPPGAGRAPRRLRPHARNHLPGLHHMKTVAPFPSGSSSRSRRSA